MTAPRIYGIVATQAPVAAIIRRGPSDWCHIGRWNLTTNSYEPGAWFDGVIYPQKCDLSPDGRWFLYSAMKVGSDWPAGDIYEAVSRLPWLFALAAWNSGSTYTRGMHFVDDTAVAETGTPDVGDVAPVLRRYGLRWTRPAQFAVERRRGWQEAPATLPRDAGGPWDERRRVEMVKPQPGGASTLHVSGRYAAFRTGNPKDDPPLYWLSQLDDLELLEDVQWADWDSSGRLVLATTGGALEMRDLRQDERSFVADLAAMKPDAQPAPDWAGEW